MGELLQIYLAKPGGQREGPYTLDQINADLAARKYSTSDFWAWHEGLPQWGPLYAIGGVLNTAKADRQPGVVANEPTEQGTSSPEASTESETSDELFEAETTKDRAK